jgi:hypothetical protein
VRDGAGIIDSLEIVNAAGNTFASRRGERLHTENSHKFTVAMFARLVAEAGCGLRTKPGSATRLRLPCFAQNLLWARTCEGILGTKES